ncbi:hypothetical protein GCM10009007_14250 [Formosimonas limnophila]|uniref:DUF3037 domain-containing protein n=1 Tax=Formosimonas limnophila TaxID=1384487 RepID=A0A8J3CN78_9BURK|nr:hypothetical protein GCM10009007_14250 [Formosimonas limnophila]
MYSLVRFRPFAETEEFANVGVLACCPSLNFIDFKIVSPAANRVPLFFDRFDKARYRTIISEFKETLKDLVFKGLNLDGAGKRLLFQAFVHPREASITMSAYRVVMSDDPSNELSRLFEHYVRQNFDARLSAEKRVENDVKAIIKTTGRSFTTRTISEHGLSVAFPFVNVRDDEPYKIIKPMYLGQEKISEVYSHGDVWVGKIKRIRHRLPKQTLFAIDGNTHKDAINEISMELQSQDVIVQPYSVDNIRLFAIQ